MNPRDLRDLMTLLKGVSRSFYLSVRILKPSLRAPIGMAYLLARASDTIADTRMLPASRRVSSLHSFSEAIGNLDLSALPEFSLVDVATSDISGPQPEAPSPDEIRLLRNLSQLISILAAMPTPDLEEIKRVLRVIISGQILDIERFEMIEGLEEGQLPCLPDPEALDDYTWRVAGIVGSFWTRICYIKGIFPADSNSGEMENLGVEFGKGLQLVNILRDLPGDLAQGRCYLPLTHLTAIGLGPGDLSKPESFERLRPVYNDWLDRALAFLRSGWQYVLSIPPDQKLMRLACAWPVLIGLETITGLQQKNPLLSPPFKVPRSWVKKMIRLSLVQVFLLGKMENVPGKILSRKDLLP
jgi:farnesyl-diphosphate farnesyltransferase